MRRKVKTAWIILLAALIVGVFALKLTTYAVTSGEYEYEDLDDGTVKITKYNGSDASVTIPQTLDGKTVSAIGEMAFGDKDITDYYIRSSTIDIEDLAIGAYTNYGFHPMGIPVYKREITVHGYVGSTAEAYVDMVNGLYIHRQDPQEYTNSDGITEGSVEKLPIGVPIWTDEDDWTFVPISTSRDEQSSGNQNSDSETGTTDSESNTGSGSQDYHVSIVGNSSSISSNIEVDVKNLSGNRYLVINDSDGSALKEELSQNNVSYDRILTFDISLTDSSAGGSPDTNFGSCTISMPLPAEMDPTKGTVRVASLRNGALEMINNTTTEQKADGSWRVKYTTTHFSEYAILYKVTTADTANSGQSYAGDSGQSSGGQSTVYRGSTSSSASDDDDDDDDEDDAEEAVRPKITQVYWQENEKSTFYWKYADEATGYRLEYSTDANFKKSATESVGRKKKSGTIKGLQVGRTYYVRVKAYEMVDGTKIWSPWSHRIVIKRKK